MWGDPGLHFGIDVGRVDQFVLNLHARRPKVPFIPIPESVYVQNPPGTIGHLLLTCLTKSITQEVDMQRTMTFFWTELPRFTPELLVAIFVSLSMLMYKPGSRRGFHFKNLDLILAHVAVARTALDLHARLLKRRQPKWACRFLRVLPPDGVEGLRLFSPPYRMALMDLVFGNVPEDHKGLVYMLASPCASYIGKAVLMRTTGVPGLCARLSEHVRCVLHPDAADGGRLRYRMFRAQGLATLRFFPILTTPTERIALVAEGLLINVERPQANAKEFHKPAVRSRGVRRRPPASVRRARGGRQAVSLWSSSTFVQAFRARAIVPPPRPVRTPLEKLLHAQLPFSDLYRKLQRWYWAISGLIGPLQLYCPDQVMLFLAWAAAAGSKQIARVPSNWARWRTASFLHAMCKELPALHAPKRRAKAQQLLDRSLRAHRLPPRRIPPLRVPAHVEHRLRPLLSRAVAAGLRTIRCRAAQDWVRSQLSFIRVPPPKWRERFNAMHRCQAFCKRQCAALSEDALLQRLALRSLRAVDGSWRLPQWPSTRSLRTAMLASWSSWANSLGAASRIGTVGRRSLRDLLARLWKRSPPPAAPRLWEKEESRLALLTDGDWVIFGDDKDSCRAWLAEESEINTYLAAQTLSDTTGTWHVTSLNLESLSPFTTASMHERGGPGPPTASGSPTAPHRRCVRSLAAFSGTGSTGATCSRSGAEDFRPVRRRTSSRWTWLPLPTSCSSGLLRRRTGCRAGWREDEPHCSWHQWREPLWEPPASSFARRMLPLGPLLSLEDWGWTGFPSSHSPLRRASPRPRRRSQSWRALQRMVPVHVEAPLCSLLCHFRCLRRTTRAASNGMAPFCGCVCPLPLALPPAGRSVTVGKPLRRAWATLRMAWVRLRTFSANSLGHQTPWP